MEEKEEEKRTLRTNYLSITLLKQGREIVDVAKYEILDRHS